MIVVWLAFHLLRPTTGACSAINPATQSMNTRTLALTCLWGG